MYNFIENKLKRFGRALFKMDFMRQETTSKAVTQENLPGDSITNNNLNIDKSNIEDSLGASIYSIETTDNKIESNNSQIGANVSIDQLNGNKTDSNSDCSYHSSDFEFITEEEAKQEGFIKKYVRKNRKRNNFVYEYVLVIFATNMNGPKWCFEIKSCAMPRMDIGHDLMQNVLLKHKIENFDVDIEVRNEAEDTKRKILDMYPIENKRRRLRRRRFQHQSQVKTYID